MDVIKQLSSRLRRVLVRPYRRQFIENLRRGLRSLTIVGQRGVGKTTCIVQYLNDRFPDDADSTKALYIPADHIVLGTTSLYEIAERFHALGGEVLALDEIHKYPGWSRELKSIHDTFPGLELIISGSSALEIHRGSHDLTRRTIIESMSGLSFREYIEISHGTPLQTVPLPDILDDHSAISTDIINRIELVGAKVLGLFQEYMKHGYYPFFLDLPDPSLADRIIEQNIRTSIETDIPAVHPGLSGGSIKRLQQLLRIIASSVPFIPDLKALRGLTNIADDRTLKTYLKYLEDAGTIRALTRSQRGLALLEKPEKIYLDNPNQVSAVHLSGGLNKGTLRETFFISALSPIHSLTAPKRGDFLVDGRHTFEVGGRNKTAEQIKSISDAYLALDDIETGTGKSIPLWLLGFVY